VKRILEHGVADFIETNGDNPITVKLQGLGNFNDQVIISKIWNIVQFKLNNKTDSLYILIRYWSPCYGQLSHYKPSYKETYFSILNSISFSLLK